MAERAFHDRRDAGRVLAGLLQRYRDDADVLVLALPRGGVPVAYEVALALGAPLDVFVVRKVGVPFHEELAMGAIASGGVVVLNDDVVQDLGIRPEVLQRVIDRERRELLRREVVYGQGRPQPRVAGRTVLLVDDGLATGASMHAAVEALQRHRPGRLVVAVPVAPEAACGALRAIVDEVVCATVPTSFGAVGQAYADFSQTTDLQVRDLLRDGPQPGSRWAPTVPAPRAATPPTSPGRPSRSS